MPLSRASISPLIFDAKGDILVGSADNTPARLAVGPTYGTLHPDSTQATGLKWKLPCYGRVLGINTVASKYRTGWAICELGGAAYFTNCSQNSTSFNGGITVNETGIYMVDGSVSIPVTCALAIGKNAPNSNVDAGPYLITTHEWQYDPSGLGIPKTVHFTVPLTAGDIVHLGIYTGGTETYTADVNSRSLNIARIA